MLTTGRYVDNVADAHVLAVENLLTSRTAAGEAISITNEQPIPFRDFCLAVWREFGHFPLFEIHIPRIIAAFFGLLADLITRVTGTATTLSYGSVNDAVSVRYCNGEKARRLLGYSPRVGLEEGIRMSCDVSEQSLDSASFEANGYDIVGLYKETQAKRDGAGEGEFARTSLGYSTSMLIERLSLTKSWIARPGNQLPGEPDRKLSYLLAGLGLQICSTSLSG